MLLSEVKVRELGHMGIEACAIMQEGESENQKEYVAVVWLSHLVMEADFECSSIFKELELQQKTPVRVLHPRSPLTGTHTIHCMRCEQIKGSQKVLFCHSCALRGSSI
ncbi:hypothetical protein BDL97_05G008400 [Sphagnum fallax]|nr:hypothetical protein BDL97_05G008400 [Sphagnum fallax]